MIKKNDEPSWCELVARTNNKSNVETSKFYNSARVKDSYESEMAVYELEARTSEGQYQSLAVIVNRKLKLN